MSRETEYRVVGLEAPYRKRFELGPFTTPAEPRHQAQKARERGDSNVRIQKRTLTATPWKDVTDE